MALRNLMNDAMNKATNAVSQAAQDIAGQGTSGVVSGILGNYTEMTLQAATEQYGMYLLPGEQYVRAFTLLRDKMLFTDRRIVFIDHQGATGVKEIIESINLDGIVLVQLETAGFGFDRAEIYLGYLLTPYAEMVRKKLEFPKGFDVRGLYCLLEEYAHANVSRLLS